LVSHPGLRRFSHQLDKVFAKAAYSIAITPLLKNAEGEKYRMAHKRNNRMKKTYIYQTVTNNILKKRQERRTQRRSPAPEWVNAQPDDSMSVYLSFNAYHSVHCVHTQTKEKTFHCLLNPNDWTL